MDDATYHALARHEHEVKASVYAEHGLFRKADSHFGRAEYHASFGQRSKKGKKVKGKKPTKQQKRTELGLAEEYAPNRFVGELPELVSRAGYVSKPSPVYSARFVHSMQDPW